MIRGTLPQRWRELLCPEDDWGPALAIHRAEYYPLQIPEARRLIAASVSEGKVCSLLKKMIFFSFLLFLS